MDLSKPFDADDVLDQLKKDEERQKDDNDSLAYEYAGDQDMDLMTLNNQAVLAYMRQSYKQCVELLFKFFDIIETNPISYFNYLLLCWEAGIHSDDFILNELHRVSTQGGNRSFTSLMYGIIYEAQNNWMPAKMNFDLAMTHATDSQICEIKRRVEKCKYFTDKFPD